MAQTKRDKFLARICRLFGCDEARIVNTRWKLFLIIGRKRNTWQDEGQWYKNGQPIDFTYAEQEIVGSGRTYNHLLTSAKNYRKLQGATR